MKLFFLLYLENFKVKASPKQCFLEADKNRGGGNALTQSVETKGRSLTHPEDSEKNRDRL